VISVLHATDRIAVPWKNGGGVTREVAIWPPGSDFENFDWRVSVAEVRVAGPFSRFEAIDRTLVILQGRLAVTVAGKEVELGPDSAPFAFPGDVACSGAPIGGAVTDLNVMTRRGRASARLKRVASGTHSKNEKTILLMAQEDTDVQFGKQKFHLARFAALLTVGPCEFSLNGAAILIAIV
jgi:environmental stress-induced protein Ves